MLIFENIIFLYLLDNIIFSYVFMAWKIFAYFRNSETMLNTYVSALQFVAKRWILLFSSLPMFSQCENLIIYAVQIAFLLHRIHLQIPLDKNIYWTMHFFLRTFEIHEVINGRILIMWLQLKRRFVNYGNICLIVTVA